MARNVPEQVPTDETKSSVKLLPVERRADAAAVAAEVRTAVEFERQMERARAIMRRDHELLRALAK